MPNAQSDQKLATFFDQCADQRLMMDFPDDEQEKLKRFMALWNIHPGCRILEPGCGSGRLTEELGRAVGSQGEVYACDLSPKMLRLAQDRNLPAQAHFAQESVLHVQRPDNWFDLVICSCVFPHFTDVAETLREFARVLKPDGSLWINHFEGSESLNRFHRTAGSEVSTHALPGRDTMEGLMREAAFRIIQLDDCPQYYILKATLQ